MQILVGTSNKGKVTEIRECLSGTKIEILTPEDMDGELAPPDETGSTFAENALQKARYYHVHTGLPTIADDSGILIDALQGELGIHTRRWGAGPTASDDEWIEHFLSRMKQEENKKAQFVCHLAHFDADGQLHMFEGICDGEITKSMESDYLPGLPISGCFRPNGYDLVYSAMSIEQKNSTSHRGQALELFRDFLAQ
jgi:non-canonical purine NTP pyrophosphatase (RdgB/HAM1 family)